MASWQFVLTDLTLAQIGEVINASNRTINFGTTRKPTPQATFRIRLDHPLAPAVALAECYLKIYRVANDGSRTLKFFGPVVGVEQSADSSGGSLAVTAAGMAWIFNVRLCGMSASGQAFSTLTDRAVIARTLIDTANTRATTRVKTDTLSYSGSTATYTAGPYKTLSQTLTELGDLLDGFDWRVDPIEKDGSGNIGIWTARPNLGVARPEAIFEFGAGRSNISDYKVQVDLTNQANYVVNPPTGSQSPIDSNDTVSQAKWGFREAAVDIQLTDNGMRQDLTDEHVRVRANPRVTVTFTPHIGDGSTRVPAFGIDYDVADVIVARAAVGRTVVFNGDFRVYGASVQIDDDGTERISLTLEDSDG